MIIDTREYTQSKANGVLEKIRGDKISQLVRLRYTFGAELRIAINIYKEPNNPKYIAELEEHEAYVEECKDTVDRAFAEIERILNDEIQNT